MQYYISTSLVLLGSLVAASPILHERQQVNCTNPEAFFFASCWETLDLPAYLTNWVKTTPVGGPNCTGRGCCQPDEPWSTCFLRLAHGVAGKDCTRINEQLCTWEPTLDPSLSPAVAPKVRYVVRNIYAIHRLINTLDTALTTAAGLTTGLPAIIYSALGLSQDPTFDVGQYQIASTAAPIFLTNQTYPAARSSIEDLRAAQAFLTSIKQAPAVAKAIYPTSTPDGSRLANYKNPINTDLKTSLEEGLDLIMNDPTQFIAFAKGGAYSDIEDIGFTQFDTAFGASINNYVTSSLLKQSGWYAVPNLTPTTLAAFQAACDANTLDGSHNICNQNRQTVYWSSDTGRTYAFAHKGKDPVGAGEVLRKAADNSWVGLNFLFDGNFNCTAAGNAGKSVLQFAPDGTPDVSCLSELPIYLPCEPKALCPSSVLVGGKCPFGYDGSCAGKEA